MISPCSLCPCTRRRSPIPPSGPSPCRILFIAEAPAKNEDAQGIPLADRGQSGMEFNEGYLPICALYRQDIAVTNAVLCSQPNYRNPTEDEAEVCSAKHLPGLLSRLRPEIIVTMGAVSASLFPGISLTLHHGIPQPATYADWSGIVLPTFHPAAGLRSTAYMIPLRQDFAALKDVLHALDTGTFSWPSDPHPAPDYSVLRTVHDLSDYLRTDTGHFFEFGTDTEFLSHVSPVRPHCLTFSHTPGTARLIYADNPAVLHAYASYLAYFRPLLSFHNYLADADPYAAMGLPIPPRRFSDTMIRAFNLGIGGGGDDEDSGAARGSLGLKVLAYRHLHMHMRSFEDVVTPYVFPLVYDYLTAALGLISAGEGQEEGVKCVCGHPQTEHKARGKSGRLTGYCLYETSTPAGGFSFCGCEKFKKQPARKPDRAAGLLARKLKTLSSQVMGVMFDGQKPGKKLDPWVRVKEWHPWEKDFMGTFLGEMPVKSIALVPESVLLGYACPDADATLRLSRFLNTYRG